MINSIFYLKSIFILYIQKRYFFKLYKNNIININIDLKHIIVLILYKY